MASGLVSATALLAGTGRLIDVVRFALLCPTGEKNGKIHNELFIKFLLFCKLFKNYIFYLWLWAIGCLSLWHRATHESHWMFNYYRRVFVCPTKKRDFRHIISFSQYIFFGLWEILAALFHFIPHTWLSFITLTPDEKRSFSRKSVSGHCLLRPHNTLHNL